mmetsp:Transcript_4753/g.6207  ORF Transcript_4753/g.6207 Transcript_4753/m.6207 type:complete len:214 (-) Transcript_4753:120-761(-)
MNDLYRTDSDSDSCESLSLGDLEETCAPVSPTNTKHDSLHEGHISWKDLQEEMRSSGIITNTAAIEYVKKRLSNQSETRPRDNDRDHSSNGLLAHFDFAFPKEDNDNINLKDAEKALFLTWNQKLSYVKGLLHRDQKQFRINQERVASNDNSPSIEKFQAELHTSLQLDDSVASLPPPVVSITNTHHMKNPIEMQDIKSKEPIQSRPYMAQSA